LLRTNSRIESERGQRRREAARRAFAPHGLLGANMDKDVLKGLALVAGVVVAVTVVFITVSNTGPQKAKCIANALKSGVPYANINHACKLSKRSY
jgi:hypothetical protein